jgi:hypothetical protein
MLSSSALLDVVFAALPVILEVMPHRDAGPSGSHRDEAAIRLGSEPARRLPLALPLYAVQFRFGIAMGRY